MASRSIDDLTPACREKYLAFSFDCAMAGIQFIVTCTLRSKVEQLALYAQGRNTLSEVNNLRAACHLPPITEAQNTRSVTWTKNSRHFAGSDGKAKAFDFAILDQSGNATWDLKTDADNDQLADYYEAGNIAESCGLTWGGRFSPPDYCHIELPAKGSQ